MEEVCVENTQHETIAKIKEENKSDDSSNDEQTTSVYNKTIEKSADEIDIKREKNLSDGELPSEHELIPPELIKKEPNSPNHSSSRKQRCSADDDESQKLRKVKELEKTLREKKEQAKVVDDLFKKFITSKMKQVEQERKKKKKLKKEKKKGYPDEVTGGDDDENSEKKRKRKKVKVKREKKSKSPETHLNSEIKQEKDNLEYEGRREEYRQREFSDYQRYSSRYDDSLDEREKVYKDQNDSNDRYDRYYCRGESDRRRERVRDEYSNERFEKRRNSSRAKNFDNPSHYRGNRQEEINERSNRSSGDCRKKRNETCRYDGDTPNKPYLNNREEYTRFENNRDHRKDVCSEKDVESYDNYYDGGKREDLRHSRADNERDYDYNRRERDQHGGRNNRETLRKHNNTDPRHDYDRQERSKNRSRESYNSSSNKRSSRYSNDQRETSDQFQKDYCRDNVGWTKDQYHKNRHSREKSYQRDSCKRVEKSSSYCVQTRESSEKRNIIRRGDHNNPPLLPPVKLLPINSGKNRDQDYSAVPPCGYENVAQNEANTQEQDETNEISMRAENQLSNSDRNFISTDVNIERQEIFKSSEETVMSSDEKSEVVEKNTISQEPDNNRIDSATNNPEKDEKTHEGNDIERNSIVKENSPTLDQINDIDDEERTEKVLKAIEDERKISNEVEHEHKNQNKEVEKDSSREKKSEKGKDSGKRDDGKNRREKSKERSSIHRE